MAREGNRADRGEKDTNGEKERVLNAWRSMLRAGTMAPSRVAMAAPEGRGSPRSASPTLDAPPEQGEAGEEAQPVTEVAQPEVTEPPPEPPEGEPEAAGAEPEPASAEPEEAEPEPEEAEPERTSAEPEREEAPPEPQAAGAPPAPRGGGAHVPPSGPIYGLGDVRQSSGASRGRRGRVAAVAVVLVGGVAIALAVAGVFSGDDESGPSGQGQSPPPRAQSPQPREPRPAPRRVPSAPAAARVAPWPEGTRAYTVVLLVSQADRSAAAQRARQAARRGMSAGVLRSDDYSLLEPGYWVTFAGQYRTKAQAQRAVLSAQRRGLARRPYTVLVNG